MKSLRILCIGIAVLLVSCYTCQAKSFVTKNKEAVKPYHQPQRVTTVASTAYIHSTVELVTIPSADLPALPGLTHRHQKWQYYARVEAKCRSEPSFA